MNFTKIENRDSVVALLKSIGGKHLAPPISQCDFLLNISVMGTSLESDHMIVVGFGTPDIGVGFTQNNNYFGLQTPMFQSAPIPMEFLWIPYITASKSMIHKLYEQQFTDKGLINVANFNLLPLVEIKQNFGGNPKNLITLEGCMFTNPVPSVNYKSAEFSVFKTNIFYRDIKYAL